MSLSLSSAAVNSTGDVSTGHWPREHWAPPECPAARGEEEEEGEGGEEGEKGIGAGKVVRENGIGDRGREGKEGG